MTVDPADFTCSALAGELADEWVELSADKDYKQSTVRQARTAVVAFCEYVDKHVPRAAEASLGRADPDLNVVVANWLKSLTSTFPSGSRGPAQYAGRVRRLVKRRAEHPQRPVVGPLRGWLKGSVGVRRGTTEELDEFSRADKLRLVKAAWADLAAIDARIEAGWALAASGVDPAVGGWLDPANLLWAIATEAYSTEEICQQLPEARTGQWPDALSAYMPESAWSRPLRNILVGGLVRQLFLHNIDLHCFRVLLIAATGHAPEEVCVLDEDDVEFGPKSVMIDFTKNRAHAEPRRSFGIDVSLEGAELHPSKPRLDAAELIRRLLELNRPLARRAGLTPVPLFLRAAVANSVFTVSPFLPNSSASNFTAWMQACGVTVQGVPDVRRMRKSGKVEKALTFKGRVSDIADDQSVETFRNHYAHGTTLRVIAGKVINAAQEKWFTEAVEGPVALSETAVESLEEPEAGAALGLSAEEVDDLIAGQLDMGVSGCKNPRQSPYGRPGQLCPVAPLRCFECRNALILPSNLPQMLLFVDFLERLELRLAPRHFDQHWTQSRVNLLAAIDARSDAEIAEARRQITEDGITLHLPLSAHVEFDA
ncbi:hypothetical protein [Streptomyces bacillaris]|uniref:hypothetical protein n=1 Tax=Streptomyces bacillaris TaxID=68179 RepID=UPI003D7126DE